MYKVSLVSEGLIDFIRHFQSKKYSKQSFSIDPSEILGRLHQNALIKMEKSLSNLRQEIRNLEQGNND